MPTSEMLVYACQMCDEHADMEWMQGTTRFYCPSCDETFDMYDRPLNDREEQATAMRIKGRWDMGSDWPFEWAIDG